jgi:hypothetical protein|mmetsp:Transcript_11405/g.14565  ORF Transcript_11405/g.14565 Transcript_11405/m.14565 type:complete len:103 (+) Transcript_11405:501-809(+)
MRERPVGRNVYRRLIAVRESGVGAFIVTTVAAFRNEFTTNQSKALCGQDVAKTRSRLVPFVEKHVLGNARLPERNAFRLTAITAAAITMRYKRILGLRVEDM